jgi:hypothetical protein
MALGSNNEVGVLLDMSYDIGYIDKSIHMANKYIQQ